MEDADRAFHVRRREVRVEAFQPLGHQQALVNDHPAGQRGDVELAIALGGEQLLGATARLEELQLELELVQPGGRDHEGLLETRQHRPRLFTAGIRIDRHHPPAGQAQAVMGAGLGQHRARTRRLGLVGGQEDVAGGVLAATQLDAGLAGGTAQEAVGLLDQQAAAVTGLAVGGDGAAVGHPFQTFDRPFDQVMAGHVVHLSNQTESAAVTLEFRPIETYCLVLRLGHCESHEEKTWGGETLAAGGAAA